MNWRSAMLAMLVVCTLVALAYLYFRNIERVAVLWLTALILAGKITAIPLIIGFAGAYDKWPGLTFLPTQMTLFYGPFIYLHVHTLMRADPPGKMYALLAPGIIYWLYQVWAFFFLGDYKSKWAFNDEVHFPYVLPIVFYTSLGFIIFAMIRLWQFRLRYLNWLKNNRSDGDAFRPIWVMRFITIGAPLAFIWALENILGRAFGLNYFERYWADIAILFLLFFIAVEALAQLQQPFPKMPSTHHHGDEQAPDTHAETLPAERDWAAEGAKLKNAVLENEWHLEPSLSLSQLARRFGMNQTYVSRALNQGLNLSFSHFINGMRIDHAKSLIVAGEHSILDIAQASGFGSKASFNRAFKLHAGVTPTSFAAKQRAR